MPPMLTQRGEHVVGLAETPRSAPGGVPPGRTHRVPWDHRQFGRDRLGRPADSPPDTRLLRLAEVGVYRYDSDGLMTVVASCSDRPHVLHPGTRWPLGALADGARESGLNATAGAGSSSTARSGAPSGRRRQMGDVRRSRSSSNCPPRFSLPRRSRWRPTRSTGHSPPPRVRRAL